MLRGGSRGGCGLHEMSGTDQQSGSRSELSDVGDAKMLRIVSIDGGIQGRREEELGRRLEMKPPLGSNSD